ncbi:MAG: hypothetical protein JKY18_07450 [Flavobacteriales bacterium]|nr:hypothetical protein [Flavobacteriales bacterium]PCH89194.1 MAG: hypothetical protein COB88_01600 [Flavobacteriales bacterium]
MKKAKIALACIVLGTGLFFLSLNQDKKVVSLEKVTINPISKGCVFMTVFGEESSEFHAKHKTPEKVLTSVSDGLAWLAKAQAPNGGFGAGQHSRQDIRDPHAVQQDPATTATVGMALMRSGSDFQSGLYTRELSKVMDYLLETVEASPNNGTKISDITGTQIQRKLGSNIDAVMVTQFFTNSLDYLDHDKNLKKRVEAALNKCVTKVQNLQEADGRTSGAGWAGVLQSGLANNALEAAQYKGADVDEEVLQKSRDYQNDNFDAKTGNADVSAGAGVVLYAVSSSVRASAKEARKVKEEMKKAKAAGDLPPEAEPTVDNLRKIGFDKDQALKANTSYNVYNKAKTVAQQSRTISGFGSNGGEEFLSFLQTGESMMVNQDNDWEKWYDNVSGRLLTIQNQDGSWNGHHCITSPVFCTAVSLLILSIENDIDKLVNLGQG